jgi:hypothetical protein
MENITANETRLAPEAQASVDVVSSMSRRAHEDRLSHNLHRQLTEVVNSYVGRCDEDAVRAGHCGRTKLCQKRCEQLQQKGKLFDHLVAL